MKIATHDDGRQDGLAGRQPRHQVNELAAEWAEYCRGYVIGAGDRLPRTLPEPGDVCSVDTDGTNRHHVNVYTITGDALTVETTRDLDAAEQLAGDIAAAVISWVQG